MRLDKYLKIARLIKRRTLAKQAADKDRILINHKLSKPSQLVKPGDIVTLNLGNKSTSIKITSLVVSKDELMYQIID